VSISNQSLEVFLTEYRQLASSFDKHATVGYTVFPLIFTAFGGFIILGQYRGEFAGLGMAVLLSLGIVWIGIGHSIMNRIGLRLVEIELKIRSCLDDPNLGGPFFFTSYVGQGAPGFPAYYNVLTTVGIAVLATSVVQWWLTMVAWQVPLAARILGASIPIALNLVAVINLCFSEQHFQQQRLKLLSDFDSQRYTK